MESSTPESNVPETNKYAALSQWCIGQADDYLRQENNVQASEKGWGATAQALKAIAEDRGWNHQSHGLVVDIAKQVADEQGRPDMVAMFGLAQALHTNFYEDWLGSDVVEIYLNAVKALLPELESVRIGPPPSPLATPTREQRNRYRRLTEERRGP